GGGRAQLAIHQERSRGLSVRVVIVPPLVGRRLRIALRRVLPLFLATKRRYIEVAPGAAHGLVAAVIDEVGAEDSVAVPQEGVCAVPLVYAEVSVEVIGEGVPGNGSP